MFVWACFVTNFTYVDTINWKRASRMPSSRDVLYVASNMFHVATESNACLTLQANKV